MKTAGIREVRQNLSALLEDVWKGRDGIYRHVEHVPATNRDAERLLVSLKHLPLRTLDALHLALAISSGAVSIVTYDSLLGEAALATGLNVFPRTSDIKGHPYP